MVPSQSLFLMYYVFEFLWLLAKHSCEVTSNSRLWKAQTEPLHLEEWKPNVPHVKILNFCWQWTGTADKEGHCVYAGVCDGFNLTSWSAFPPCRHRCGWVVVAGSLSLTLTSLISCLPSQALSRSLPPGLENPRLSQNHKYVPALFI